MCACETCSTLGALASLMTIAAVCSGTSSGASSSGLASPACSSFCMLLCTQPAHLSQQRTGAWAASSSLQHRRSTHRVCHVRQSASTCVLLGLGLSCCLITLSSLTISLLQGSSSSECSRRCWENSTVHEQEHPPLCLAHYHHRRCRRLPRAQHMTVGEPWISSI